jgi:cell division protein FtsL
MVRTEDNGIPLFASHDHLKDQTKNGKEGIAFKHTGRRLTGPKVLLFMMIMLLLLLLLMMMMINYTYYI